MCGRYSVFDERDIVEMKRIIDEIDRRFAVPPPTAVPETADEAVQSAFVEEPKVAAHAASTGEIFPTNSPPVIMPWGEKWRKAPVPMYWGFPKYDRSGVIINARLETAYEKPLFRRAMYQRRVLVPTTGFYEWDKRGGTKDKYIFLPRGSAVAYMAGIFGLFSDGNSEYAAFVILTRPANEDMERFHDRMPVIIPKISLDDWLFDERAARLLTAGAPPRLDYARCE